MKKNRTKTDKKVWKRKRSTCELDYKNPKIDKLVSWIAGIGIPGLVLFSVMKATGLFGAAAIAAALSLIGPGGMIGGVMTLIVTCTIIVNLSEYEFQTVFYRILMCLLEQGRTRDEIIDQIRKYPISVGLKLKLINSIEGINMDQFKTA